MKVLVTGGAGFIGSHLVERFTEEGASVIVLDDLSTGDLENLESVQDSITFSRGCITDPEALREAVSGAELVLHFAAIPSVPASFEEPRRTTEVNLQGTVSLLEECRRGGVRRVIFASSSAVYGEQGETPIRETLATEPISPYGVQKLAAEHFCHVLGSGGTPDALCFRLFNVYGPRQRSDSDYAAVIPRFRARAREGKPAIVHGDGEQTRDFIHVADVVEAVWRAATVSEAWNGSVFNLARGEGIRILDLARLIHQEHQLDGKPERTPPREGDILHSVADMARLRSALGWSPEIDLATGLRLPATPQQTG